MNLAHQTQTIPGKPLARRCSVIKAAPETVGMPFACGDVPGKKAVRNHKERR